MQTSEKQTLQSGEEELTCFREDFLANRSVWQEKEKERAMTATSGLICFALYKKSDQLGSLVRTLLASSRWYSPVRKLRWEAKPIYSERLTEKEYYLDRNTLPKLSVETLNVKDIPSSRLLFRLVPSVRHTEETACGLLPTVQTQGLKRCNAEGKTEFMPLDLLPTPTSIDSGSGRINKSPSPGAKERPTIALAAKMGLLPTPRSNKVNNLNLDSQTLAARNKWNLEEAIALSLTHKTENSPQTTGATFLLNSRFVAEMMSFPPDWTELPFLAGGRNR